MRFEIFSDKFKSSGAAANLVSQDKEVKLADRSWSSDVLNERSGVFSHWQNEREALFTMLEVQ